MDNHYTLYQLDDEHGDLFLNSGPDPLPLIDAGRKLATWTDADFAVNCKDDLVWSSREPKKGVHFQLVRSEGAVSILILPGSYAEGLIKTGQLLAEQQPEWTLEVQDKKLRAIWTTKKVPPAKPRTPHRTAGG